jgi:hypothetical protein
MTFSINSFNLWFIIIKHQLIWFNFESEYSIILIFIFFLPKLVWGFDHFPFWAFASKYHWALSFSFMTESRELWPSLRSYSYPHPCRLHLHRGGHLDFQTSVASVGSFQELFSPHGLIQNYWARNPNFLLQHSCNNRSLNFLVANIINATHSQFICHFLPHGFPVPSRFWAPL